MSTTTRRPLVGLVCGGQWHDFEFARLELLRLLSEHPEVRTRVAEDYSAPPDGLDALITYTCNVVPSEAQQAELVDFVARGGRWLALHATNSAIVPAAPQAPYRFTTPRTLGRVAEVLGSQFLGHPPIEPYTVTPVDASHPLVAGIGPFAVSDELYVSELHGPLNTILETRFVGASPSFEEGDAALDATGGGVHPVLYTRSHGAGMVTYFTLGHCRGRFDIQDLGVDDLGVVDRGSWVSPEFRTILERCVRWAVTGEFSA